MGDAAVATARRSASAARALHFSLGSQERFREDQQMSQAREKELERRRDASFRKDCTFAPNVASAATAAATSSSAPAAADGSSIANNDASTASVSSSLAARTGDVIARLQQSDVNRRQRLEEALKRAEAAKLRGLTFKPQINDVSSKVHAEHVRRAQQLQSSDDAAAGADSASSSGAAAGVRDVLAAMKVEDRLLQEGRMASERRERMRQDLERQQRAMLDTIVPRSSSSHSQHQRHHHDPSSFAEEGEEGEQSMSFFMRMQEAQLAAKENRERLRAYLERQHTFQPSINQVSAATVSMLQDAEQQQQQQYGESSDALDGTERNDAGSFVSRLHDKSVQERTQRQREREQQAARQQHRQYTFTPRVGLKSAQLAVRRAVSQGGGTFAQRQQQAEEARRQHLQLIRDAQLAKERSEQRPPTVVRTDGKAVPTGIATGRRQLDASEMSEHVRRMETTVQQRAVRLKELAERTTALQCPFQPTTTRHSAEIVARKFGGTEPSSPSAATPRMDVVQRMELEQQLAQQRAAAANAERARKQREEEEQWQRLANHPTRAASLGRSASASAAGGVDSAPRARASSVDSSAATTTTTTQQQQQERLYEFFEHQDDHVRRRENRVSEMRRRLERDELSKCTFHPRINVHSGGAANSSASAPALDEQVRGIGSVRARVALAARLKAEQAEREAKAFGIRSNGGGGVNISVSLDPTITSSNNSVSRPRVRSSTPTRQPSSGGLPPSAQRPSSAQRTTTPVRRAESNAPPIPAASAATVQISLQRGRERLYGASAETRAQTEQDGAVATPNTDHADGRSEQRVRLQQQRSQQQQAPHRYIPPPDSPDGSSYSAADERRKLAGDVMRGAGLLPAQLLSEYEADWLASQQQQQDEQEQEQDEHLQRRHHKQPSPAPSAPPPPPIPPVTTSTPRMALKKRGGVATAVVAGDAAAGFMEPPEDIAPQQQQQRKKSAALDLALKKHLAADTGKR